MKQATDTERNNSLRQTILYTADRTDSVNKLRLDYSNRNKLRIATQIKNNVSTQDETSDSDLIQDKYKAT